MFDFFKSISQIFEHPVFAAYTAKRRHRFHNHILALAAVWIYEILMLLARTPHIVKLEGADLWYQLVWKMPMHSSLPFTVILTYVLGRDLLLDYNGEKDSIEKAADKAAIEKSKSPNVTGTIKDGKVEVLMVPPPTVFEPKAKEKYRLDPAITIRMIWESMLLGSILWAGLPLAVGFLTGNWTQIVTTPLPIPTPLLEYQSNVFQNIGISLGSGFYEELIFRYSLIKALNGVLKKWLPPVDKITFWEIKKENRAFRSQFMAVVLAGLIYTLSHLMIPVLHPNAEMFTAYNFIYRWLFGIMMSYILIKRKFAIAVWTHGFYEIFYFAFL